MRTSTSLSDVLEASLGKPSIGKVRDSYRIKPWRPTTKLRFPVVSNRASIFDFKLGTEIEGKGEALNAFNIAARLCRRTQLPDEEDDLIAYGVHVDSYLPPELKKMSTLWRQATVVEELQMEDKECVCRGYATGNLWKAYKKGDRVYCGHALPDGLVEGMQLPEPIFTPTTKAKVGPDDPLDYREVRLTNGIELEEVSMADFKLFAGYSLGRGVIGVDDKREYGRRTLPDGTKSRPILADEAWTADSSRFWDLAEYQRCFPARLPVPMDKQALRNWGKEQGIDQLDPKNPEHVEHVYALEVPRDITVAYLQQIHRAFEMLWGQPLADFQREVMGIR